MRRLFFCLIVSTVIIQFGCRRYEDGPFLSFRNQDTRLCDEGGKWEIIYFSIDGSDTTEAVLNSSSYSIYRFTNNRIYHDQWSSEILALKPDDINTSSPIVIGEWEFGKSFNTLDMYIDSAAAVFPSIGPYQNICKTQWEIKKLTSKKLWIEYNYNDRKYLIKYQKI